MGKKHDSQYANFGWLQNKFKIFNYLSFHNDFIDKLYTIFI